MSEKWTEHDIPDQQGRVAVVTGANTGLGFETARMLAARRASVVLAVRDVEKGKQAAARIADATPGADLSVVQLDLTALESVMAAAAELRARHSKIHLLINNAGVMYPPRRTTTRTGSSCSSAPTTSGTSRLRGCCWTGCRACPVHEW